MTSVLLASGIPEPRQVQNLARARRRQGGQTITYGRARPEPIPGPAAHSSHDAGGGGGRQPEGQVRTGVLGLSRDTVFGQGRAG